MPPSAVKEASIVKFNSSDALTFGLELELQIVDAATGMLSPSSTSIWPLLQSSSHAKQYALEATLATMEINSSIHADADGMSREVQDLTQLLRDHAQSLGLDVRGGGTQLTQFWNDRVFAPTARSQELEGRAHRRRARRACQRTARLFFAHVRAALRATDLTDASTEGRHGSRHVTSSATRYQSVRMGSRLTGRMRHRLLSEGHRRGRFLSMIAITISP
jgi:hypothetical protein